VEFEAAGRYERASVVSQPVGFHRGFDLWSAAAGVSWTFAEGWKLGANYVRGARAPAPEELLSDGMHVATQSYERGDPDFAIERSHGYEAYLRHDGERLNLSLTGFLTDFDRFITALPTGAEIEGLPVFAYAQVPARYQGFEASASWTALETGSGKLLLDAGVDYTHARLKGIGPVPRIPPLRLRSGAEWHDGPYRLRAEIEWNDAQNRVAAFEGPVSGFTVVNVSADWHPMGEDGPLTLLLSADNLLDVDGRRAASYTRDFVPIAGRDLRITAKLVF
jgi:iron complex outermembrane receptor protein